MLLTVETKRQCVLLKLQSLESVFELDVEGFEVLADEIYEFFDTEIRDHRLDPDVKDLLTKFSRCLSSQKFRCSPKCAKLVLLIDSLLDDFEQNFNEFLSCFANFALEDKIDLLENLRKFNVTNYDKKILLNLLAEAIANDKKSAVFRLCDLINSNYPDFSAEAGNSLVSTGVEFLNDSNYLAICLLMKSLTKTNHDSKIFEQLLEMVSSGLALNGSTLRRKCSIAILKQLVSLELIEASYADFLAVWEALDESQAHIVAPYLCKMKTLFEISMCSANSPNQLAITFSGPLISSKFVLLLFGKSFLHYNVSLVRWTAVKLFMEMIEKMETIDEDLIQFIVSNFVPVFEDTDLWFLGKDLASYFQKLQSFMEVVLKATKGKKMKIFTFHIISSLYFFVISEIFSSF